MEMNRTMSSGSLDTVESLIGRRLRPWWGESPSSLVFRGVIGLVVMGFIMYGCLQVLSGSFDLGDAGLAEQDDLVRTIALVVMALAGIGVIYNVVRVVVGVVDLTTRRTIDGIVIQVRRRYAGDVLPRWVQWGWRTYKRSRDPNGYYDEPGRIRHELTIDTDRGSRTLPIRPSLVNDLDQGARVRVTSTRFTSYVSRVARL